MSRDTDWHVFDKACEITAMAARGTAGQVTPPRWARSHAGVRRLARRGERAGQCGITGGVLAEPPRQVAQRHDADQPPVFQDRDVAEALLQHPFVGFGDRRLGGQRDGIVGHPTGDGVTAASCSAASARTMSVRWRPRAGCRPPRTSAAPTWWMLMSWAASATVASGSTVTRVVHITSRSASMARAQPSLSVAARKALLDWYRPRARAYPWRRGRPNAYRTLVSELMLQQTQASRVEPAFRAFLRRFPTLLRSLRRAEPTSCVRGRDWATTGGRSTCTRRRRRLFEITAGACRPTSTRFGRCRASVRTPPRRSRRSPAVWRSPRPM